MFRDITKASREVNRLAHEKGWYDNGPRPIPERLMLIVSELAEAIGAFRERGSASWLTETGKPEGLTVELADAVIRTLDLAEEEGMVLSVPTWGEDSIAFPTPLSIATVKMAVADMVEDLSRALEAYRVNDRIGVEAGLEDFLETMWRECAGWHVPLLEECARKHAYNTTREYRHGGKVI